MELCYEGGLVMPSSYAMMDEEEMTYVEGGGLGRHFYNKSTVCLATTILSCITSAILRVAGTSIGSLITYGIDMVDGARDGYCFA